MRISVPYGRTRMVADVPDARLLGVFEAPIPSPAPDPDAEVARALDAPFGSPRLEELARGKRKLEGRHGLAAVDGQSVVAGEGFSCFLLLLFLGAPYRGE